MGACGSKLKPWRRSSKVENISCHEKTTPAMNFDDVVEAVMRAPLKDFLALRKEWAATRIQAAFRVFLARKALRALKAVVRLQAMFRGQSVRRQALLVFHRMESIVQAQKRVCLQRKTANLNAAKKSISGRSCSGYACLKRSISSKSSRTEHPEPDKRPNLAAARSVSDPGQLKYENFAANCSGYCMTSASPSSFSCSSQLETEEFKVKLKSNSSQRLKNLFEEIQRDMELRMSGDRLGCLIEGSAEGSEEDG